MTHGIFNQHFVQAAALNFKVSVLHVCSDQRLQKKFEFVSELSKEIKVQYVYFKKVKSKIPLFSNWLKYKRRMKAYQLGYKKLFDQKSAPNLIHLNVVLPAGLFVLHLHKKLNIPYVVNEGWTGYLKEDGSYKGFLLKYFTKRVFYFSSCIMPVSEGLMNAMKTHNLQGHYRVVPNIIRTDIYQPDLTQNPKLQFIHVSTFDPKQKNVFGILRAFKRIVEIEPNYELLLVGDGEFRLETENYVSDLYLNQNVKFMGSMNAESLRDLYISSKALLMFSNYESFGVVLGEALACGLPVVSSRAGGLSIDLSVEHGVFVKKGNEEQLCAAISQICKNKFVFDKLNLHKYIDIRYSEKVIAETLHEIYTEVLEK